MTTCEKLFHINDQNLDWLITHKLMRASIKRDILIFEAYLSLTADGCPSLQAMIDIADQFRLSDKRVEAIIYKFRSLYIGN